MEFVVIGRETGEYSYLDGKETDDDKAQREGNYSHTVRVNGVILNYYTKS